MELRILWMYHDLMDLYGDKGNIQVLKTRCSMRGIKCTVDTCAIGEDKDPASYDLFFMGGGADFEQSLIFSDLLSRKEQILKAKDEGVTFLLICGGYQLFGQYYIDQDGKRVDGLGIYDYFTRASDRDHRCIGNIAVEVSIDGKTIKVIGFENHGGQTMNVSKPFGRVLKGHGNEYHSSYEGYMDQQVVATYMHGPLLPKNPELSDILIERALRHRYENVTLDPLDDTLEHKAADVMLRRLGVL